MSILVKILIGFGIFLFIILWMMIPYLIEKPVITVDYFTQYNDLTRPENFNEAENAATLLENLPAPEKIGNKTTPGGSFDPNIMASMPGMMGSFGPDLTMPDFTWKYEYADYPDKFTPQEISKFEEWVKSYQKTLRAIVEASKKPYYYKPVDPTLYRSELLESQINDYADDTISLSELGSILSWALVYHLDNDECKKVNEYAQSLLNLYKLLNQYPCGYRQYETEQLMTRLDFIYTHLQNQKQLSPEALLSLQNLLSQTALIVDYDPAAQQLCFLDFIQKTFTKGDRGHLSASALIKQEVVYITFGDVLDVFSCLYKSLKCEDRKRTVDRMEKIYTKLKQWKGQTLYQLHQQGIDCEKEIRSIVGKNFIVEEQSEYLLYGFEQSHRIACRLEAVATITAIYRYYLEKNECPESLETLLAENYINRLPRDAYSDGPLIYRKQDDNFILYSVGVDFEDDGGRPSLCKHCGDHLTDWGDGLIAREENEDNQLPIDTQKDAKGDHVFWPIPKDKDEPEAVSIF